MEGQIASIVEKKISNILNEFLNINGITAVAIVGRDGFVIESSSNVNLDIDSIGAMVATAIGTAENLGDEFELNGIKQYLSEFSHGKVIMATVKDDILVLFTDTNAVIGAVRYAIKKFERDILSVLR